MIEAEDRDAAKHLAKDKIVGEHTDSTPKIESECGKECKLIIKPR
jgi:hypothetical protein